MVAVVLCQAVTALRTKTDPYVLCNYSPLVHGFLKTLKQLILKLWKHQQMHNSTMYIF